MFNIKAAGGNSKRTLRNLDTLISLAGILMNTAERPYKELKCTYTLVTGRGCS